MPRLKLIAIILNSLYLVMVTLFLLDELTGFDIKNQFLKFFIYPGTVLATPIIFICNLILVKNLNRKIQAEILPVIMTGVTLYFGYDRIFTSSAAWKTQTILYEHKITASKKIEFQVQFMGAAGYNKRTVKVYYFTPLFMITSPVTGDIHKQTEWIAVNKNVNEMGLKGW